MMTLCALLLPTPLAIPLLLWRHHCVPCVNPQQTISRHSRGMSRGQYAGFVCETMCCMLFVSVPCFLLSPRREPPCHGGAFLANPKPYVPRPPTLPPSLSAVASHPYPRETAHLHTGHPPAAVRMLLQCQ